MTLPTWAIAVGVASILVAAAIVVVARTAAPLAPAARNGVLACAVTVIAYIAVLNGVEIHSLLNDHGTLLQGRYLTAVAPLAVAGLLTLASRLPARRCAALCIGLCLVWLVLALDALDLVVRYYAT
jgi:hypothetical protein